MFCDFGNSPRRLTHSTGIPRETRARTLSEENISCNPRDTIFERRRDTLAGRRRGLFQRRSAVQNEKKGVFRFQFDF